VMLSLPVSPMSYFTRISVLGQVRLDSGVQDCLE